MSTRKQRERLEERRRKIDEAKLAEVRTKKRTTPKKKPPQKKKKEVTE